MLPEDGTISNMTNAHLVFIGERKSDCPIDKLNAPPHAVWYLLLQ
jgi:hypothetical protein